MDKSHASLSSLTFQQVHKLLKALKTNHCCAYQKCYSEIKSQVRRYLSQENQMDKTLLDVSIFHFQKSQINYLNSSKPYKVANRYSSLKNSS